MAAIKTETFMLDSPDPGVQIHVRNKRLAGNDRFAANRIVLFVHGATYPAETGFDFAQPGGSWMDIAASQGFDAYCVDVRGLWAFNPPCGDVRAAAGEPTVCRYQ